MSFDLVEVSRFLGRPVHLFLFTRQSQVWRFASGGRDVVVSGHTYVGAQIGRSEIQQTVEREKDKLTITFPYLLDPAAPEYPPTQSLGNNWRPYIPSSPISVVCMATHIGDASAPAIEWMGVVTEVAHTDTKMTLTCEPSNSSSQARNQGAKWQRGCWKTVYSTGLRGCHLVAGPIPVVGTLTAVSGSDITAAEFVEQQRTFVGGTAEWIADAPELAEVTDLTGSDVTLDNVTGIEVGMVLTWTGGSGEVTAIAGSVVTLDDVGDLAVNIEVSWGVPTPYNASITGHSGTTLTLDDVTGLAIGSEVTAYTIPLWTEGTLAVVSGFTLTAPEFSAAPFNLTGGSLTWVNDVGLVERRPIMSHNGDTVTVLYGSADLDTGLAVVAVPGCPRTWSACTDRNNTINYGGAIYKPAKNPTDESMSWG